MNIISFILILFLNPNWDLSEILLLTNIIHFPFLSTFNNKKILSRLEKNF